jgi:ketosteroid isomerase-like protein
MIRRSFAALRRGDWQDVVARFADGAHFRFPGEHMFAGEYRDKGQMVAAYEQHLGAAVS